MLKTSATATLTKTSYVNNTLTLTLSGLPTSYTNTQISISGTYGAGNNPLSSITINQTANDGEFTIAIDSLTDDDKVIITEIKIDTTALTHLAGEVFYANEGPTVTPATTNSTSSESGVTSSAVTLTWTKPTKAEDANGNLVDIKVPTYNKTDVGTDYKITIDDGAGFNENYYSLGKTTLVITNLDPGKEYSYKVESKLTARTTGGTAPATDASGYAVVASGLFETESATLADDMAVGRPTDVKTTPTDSNVKITWKAPLNYTGAYTITVTNLSSNGTPSTGIVDAGITAVTLTYSTEDLSGVDPSTWKLKSGNRYEVVITPISGNSAGTNGLSSTPTNFVAARTQIDPTVTVTKTVPAAAPATDLVAITTGSKPDTVKIKLDSSKTIPSDVDGYWIKLNTSTAPSVISSDPVSESFVYITKAQLTAGVDIIATGLTNVAARIQAANSAGYEATGVEITSSVSANSSGTSLTTASLASASAVTGTVDGNKITVTWKNNNTAIASSDTGYFATKYDVYVSRATGGPWVWVGEKTGLDDTTEDSELTLVVPDLEYGTDYYFAVIATCNDTDAAAAKVAALTASSVVKTGAAPTVTVDAKTILTAKKVSSIVAGSHAVTFSLDAFSSAKNKIDPDQYYVVLRDANKAVIASGFVALNATTPQLSLPTGVTLTPKAKYTVEVYGVSGKTVGSTKVSGTLTVADYPAATLKVASNTKATVNGVSISVTDKNTNGKFYYVQYTSVADAKSKPDWSTAIVEKLPTASLPTSSGGVAYSLGTKLDPNTQYYIRIVTADADVAITGSGANATWTNGNAGGLDDWNEATTVVFGKELKVKTAAVPLATTGKPALSLNSTDYNITLKTTGQTMLSAKGADAIFTNTNAPLTGATFSYKLLVSLDSKVDKVTGKLLGSAEINLTTGTNIKIEDLPAKGNVTKVTNGQYTLEYALTGADGIIKALGVTASNISNLKSLNFQLVTTVTYDSGNASFDSVSKVGKVTMPKWFV
jgi:hypothetical protein